MIALIVPTALQAGSFNPVWSGWSKIYKITDRTSRDLDDYRVVYVPIKLDYDAPVKVSIKWKSQYKKNWEGKWETEIAHSAKGQKEKKLHYMAKTITLDNPNGLTDEGTMDFVIMNPKAKSYVTLKIGKDKGDIRYQAFDFGVIQWKVEKVPLSTKK